MQTFIILAFGVLVVINVALLSAVAAMYRLLSSVLHELVKRR